MSEFTLIQADRLVTCDPGRSTGADPLGVITRGAVLCAAGRIVFAGEPQLARAQVPEGAKVHELRAALVTPGLVDAHTHAAWVGSRHDEYALRMSGADYETIAKAGGGIASTMRSVRAASEETIANELRARLQRMARAGVTTVEVKSGYGLDRASEAKQLGAIGTVAAEPGAPRVSATYLALHALPPEAGADRTAYAARVVREDLPALAADLRFSFVDAYIDRSAFAADDARPLFTRARDLGLGVRAHVGQFADVGGAELAAEVHASSVDHLEHVSSVGAAGLARAGVRAVLLPVASFTLGQVPPPVDLLRREGVRLVVASDANPGTAPTESLQLAMALAVRSYGLSVAEMLLGVTREAAASLGLADVGYLAAGTRADVVLWDLPHEAALAQPWGVPRTVAVLRDGRVI
jgi:imidazolonepropionase